MKSLSWHKKKLWTAYSKYRRLAEADYRGYVTCFTCGKTALYKEMQLGHWVSRKYNSTFIDERNTQCQCKACNIFLSGNMDEFAVHLIEKYGAGILESLTKLKHETKKFIIPEVEDLTKEFRERAKRLE